MTQFLNWPQQVFLKIDQSRHTGHYIEKLFLLSIKTPLSDENIILPKCDQMGKLL